MAPSDFMHQVQQRDAWLIVLLIVIAILWWLQNRALADLERFLNDQPETKQQFRAWKLRQVRCFVHNRPDCKVCGGKPDD